MADIEIWKPVPGYEGKYEVSSQGRVKSIARFNSRGYRLGERMLSPIDAGDGHLKVSLYSQAIPTRYYIHSLVLRAFIGEPKDGQVACHNNGVPGDNRIENLRWGTYSDNAQDSLKHGTNFQSRKTHCPRGHLLKMPNLRKAELAKGERKCLACRRAQGVLEKNKSLRPLMDDIANDKYRKIMGE